MSTIRAKAFQHPSATSNNITFNADGTHTVNAQHPITNKNLLINGGMNVWQRNTSKTGITSGAYHTADRWHTALTTAGTWTQSRSTDVPSAQGFGYSLKMDCTTADASLGASDVLTVLQRFEGQNLQHLLKGTSSAKKLTLSFWVKSNKTGTYIAELVDNDNTRQISKSYTINSADTWEKKEITYDGDTSGVLDNDNEQSMRVIFWLAAGSNFTSGTLNTSWASTTNANRVVGQVNLADSTSNEWYITGCQLEVGSTASGFEFEPNGVTKRKCFRYFERGYGEYYWSPRSRSVFTSSNFCIIFLKESMRTNPTVSNVTTTNVTGHTVVRFSAKHFMGEGGASSSSGTARYTGWQASAEL